MIEVDKDLVDLIGEVKSKPNSAQNLVEAFFEGSVKSQKSLNAYISLGEPKAASADTALAGLPVAVKDSFCTMELKTTAGSKILENYHSPFESTVTDRLWKAGGQLLGKTNQDEFAMGSTNQNSYFGPCLNPHNLKHVPGGSSGGSAAIVASGAAPAALGTDTGGSVRQPGHFCGVVGFKPTYGRLSRYGIISYASSLDQAGFLTRSVRDAAYLMDLTAGHCEFDATSSKRPKDPYYETATADLQSLTIGLLKFSAELDPACQTALNQAKSALEAQGHKVVDVEVEALEVASSIYYLIATSEASSNLARYDGVRFGHRTAFNEKELENLEQFYAKTRGEGFGVEAKRRILLGTFSLSAGYSAKYFEKACRARRLISQSFDKAFSKVDAILSPVTCTRAFAVDNPMSPVDIYNDDYLTVPANLAGLPGISVPAYRESGGLPAGVQLMANRFDDAKLLHLAHHLQQGLKSVIGPNYVEAPSWL